VPRRTGRRTGLHDDDEGYGLMGMIKAGGRQDRRRWPRCLVWHFWGVPRLPPKFWRGGAAGSTRRRSCSLSRSPPCSNYPQVYLNEDGSLDDVIEVAVGLIQQDLDVFHCSASLLLDVVGHQFHGRGVDARLRGDVHEAFVDCGAGVGAYGFGTFEGVYGLDYAAHNISRTVAQESLYYPTYR
jgi:hypothetical protein